MKRKIYAGSTSLTLIIFVQDTSQTNGAGLTGLTSSSPGLVCKYRRQGQNSWTTVSLSAGVLGTWSSGGFIADTGAAPGTYELGVPDAAIAAGGRWVAIQLYGAANMLLCNIEIELDAVNYQSTNSFITGMNGLVPPANWNLMSLDASGRVLLQAVTHTGAIIPQVNSLTDARMAYLDAGISTVGSLAASAILVNPLNKLYTNASNQVLVGGISDVARQYMWEIPENTVAATGSLFAKFKLWNMGPDGRQYITSTNHTAGATVAGVAGTVTVGTNNDKDGYTLTVADKENIAVRVESHLLDEGDSQMLINAIVAAIGNTNVNQAAFVAAIRADIERAGGILALMFADYARRTGDYSTPASIASLATQATAIKTQTDKIPTSPAATSDIPTASQNASAVWASGNRSLTSFGTLIADLWAYSTRSLTAADKEDIATRVESHLINEADGQTIVNAIVGAIGNTNINQVSLVAAIRADIERNGGYLALMFLDYARRTGDYATAANVSAVGTKVDGVKTKTDGLNFNGPNVLAQSQNLPTDYQKSGQAVTLPPNVAQQDKLLAVASAVDGVGNSVTDVKTTTNTISSISVRLDDMMESVNGYTRLKETALELAPVGDGGGNGSGGNVHIPAGSVLFNPVLLDEEGAAIPLGLVAIYQGSERVGAGTTNADGRVQFSNGEGFVLLQDVEYTVRIYASGYVAQPPFTMSLSEDAAPEYTLEALSPFPVSDDVEMAIIRVRTADFVGKPLADKVVKVILEDERNVVMGNAFRLTREIQGVTKMHTDQNGNQDAYVDLKVPHEDTLIAAGLKPIYVLDIVGLVDCRIRVKAQGGLASTMRVP